MADTLGEGEHGFTNAEMLLLVRERQQTYERINSARHKEQAKKLLSADMEGSAPGHVVTGDTLQNFIAQNSTLPQDVPWMLYHVEEYLVKHHQGAASKEACEQFIKEVREIVAPVVLSRTDIHGLLNMTPNEDHKVCLVRSFALSLLVCHSFFVGFVVD